MNVTPLQTYILPAVNYNYGQPITTAHGQPYAVPILNIYDENYIKQSINNNQDYLELKDNKFFKNINIPYLMSNLKRDRDYKIAINYDPYPRMPIAGTCTDWFTPKTIVDYKKYDIPDYLKILNNFVKNDKISADLKEYYISKESNKLENYYTKLDKIFTVQNNREVLNYLLS